MNPTPPKKKQLWLMYLHVALAEDATSNVSIGKVDLQAAMSPLNHPAVEWLKVSKRRGTLPPELLRLFTLKVPPLDGNTQGQELRIACHLCLHDTLKVLQEADELAPLTSEEANVEKMKQCELLVGASTRLAKDIEEGEGKKATALVSRERDLSHHIFGQFLYSEGMTKIRSVLSTRGGVFNFNGVLGPNWESKQPHHMTELVKNYSIAISCFRVAWTRIYAILYLLVDLRYWGSHSIQGAGTGS